MEEIDPHWRAQQWLQVATQGIRDEEVPWHELLTLLTLGAEGTAKVPGQASCGCVAVEHQGVRAGHVPTRSFHPQHWPVSY